MNKWILFALAVIALWLTGDAFAHNVSREDAELIAGKTGVQFVLYLWLGAKHMVTGYDHLLFLVGVIFYLKNLRTIALFVSLFALGHSITLMGGVLLQVNVNAYLIDAIIGLSVVYKAFENIDGFKQVFGLQLNARLAVFIFGLFHGLGLATKLQEFAISSDGLVTNIVSFNVGVEIGQAIALALILIVLFHWRQRDSFQNHAFIANTLLMTAGFVLAGYQIAGYMSA